MRNMKLIRHMALATGVLAIPSTYADVMIEEVIVTATKRAESIQDVPISISAFSEGFIEDSGITDLQELGAYAPNLSLNTSANLNNTRIIIRGVGSVGNAAIESSVAVFIDGVYYPRPGSVVGKLQDIAAVEVLRGPQGTLFGRNASMGALNISTKKPDQENTTDISFSLGNYDSFSTSVTINGGLTDTVAGRLSVQYSDKGGFGTNTFDGAEIGEAEDLGIRGALSFDISDSTQATLRADWKKIENNGPLIEVDPDSVLPVYLGRIGAVLDPSFADGIGNGPRPDTSDAFDLSVNQKHTDRAEDEQSGFSLDVEGELEKHSWRSITSFRTWENSTFEDVIRFPADILPRDTDFGADTYSQEFQLLSNLDGAFQYVTGAYLYHEKYTLDQDLNFGADFCSTAVFNNTFFQHVGTVGPATATAIATGTANFCNAGAQVGAVNTQFEQEVDSVALFAQGTYDISDTLSATFGIRWTDDEKSGTFTQVVNNPVAGPAGLNLRANEPTQQLDVAESKVTWMTNLRYNPTDNLMMFLTASTGYKAGGFNSDGAAVNLGALGKRTFNSEEVTNYEFGIKSTIDDRYTVNATLFRTDIDDFQDRLFDGLSFVVVNAGELRQQGVEIDVNAQVTENLSGTLGLSFLDSEFLDYKNGTALPGFSQNIPQDLTGSRNNYSPEYQASASLEWRDELGDNLEWFIRGEYQYVDDQNVNGQTDNNPAQIRDGYDLVNARFGISPVDGKWDVTLFGRNLSDEGYCQATFYQPLASTLNLVDPARGNAMTRCVVGQPRTYGLTFNYHIM